MKQKIRKHLMKAYSIFPRNLKNNTSSAVTPLDMHADRVYIAKSKQTIHNTQYTVHRHNTQYTPTITIHSTDTITVTIHSTHPQSQYTVHTHNHNTQHRHNHSHNTQYTATITIHTIRILNTKDYAYSKEGYDAIK